MPLQKLQFRPGINREGTTLANEGGWYAGDKIRFRSGQVEKIGGWVLDGGTVTTGGQYIGVIRSLWNWIGLNGYNYMGIGTNQKFYIQQGTGGFHDVLAGAPLDPVSGPRGVQKHPRVRGAMRALSPSFRHQELQRFPAS